MAGTTSEPWPWPRTRREERHEHRRAVHTGHPRCDGESQPAAPGQRLAAAVRVQARAADVQPDRLEAPELEERLGPGVSDVGGL